MAKHFQPAMPKANIADDIRDNLQSLDPRLTAIDVALPTLERMSRADLQRLCEALVGGLNEKRS